MIRQFYYTSCQAGLGTSSGYQFNAVTPGIDQDVLKMAQTLVSYEPPPSAPAQPAADELEKFPVALSYLLLAPSSALVCRSVYIGRDYSGRFGNFFAHGVHVDPSTDLGLACPVDLWDSPSWSHAESASTELPALGPLAPGPPITDADLAAFLDADGRRAQLYPFLVAIRQSLDAGGRQIVMVEASSAHTARWVALATRSLPRRLALQLTFTTYTRRPYYSTHRLIGIAPDSDFRFSPSEINDQYMVFDFVGRRFSPAADNEWASLAATFWDPASKATMAQFHDFLGDVGLANVPTDLGAALAAFGLARGCEVPDRSLRRAVAWADGQTARLPQGFWKAFAARLAARIPALGLVEVGTISRSWSKGPQGEATDVLVRAYVEALARQLATGDGAEGAWFPDRPVPALALDTESVLVSAVERGASIDVLATMLRLFDALGQPVGDGALAGVGRDRLGPDLVAGRADAKQVLSLLAVPGSAAIGTGLCEHLQSVAAKDLGAAELAVLLAGPLGPWVTAQGLPDSSPLILAQFVQIGRRDPWQRVEMLNELLGEMSRIDVDGGTRDGAALDAAVELLWRDEPVTVADARRIVVIVPLEQLAASRRVGWITAAVTAAEALDPSVRDLATKLFIDGHELGISEADLQLLEIIQERRPPLGPYAAPEQLEGVARTIIRLESTNTPIASVLLDELARRVMHLGPEDQSKVLLDAVSNSWDGFMAAYRRHGARFPGQWEQGWSLEIASRFALWIWLAQRTPVAGAELLAQVLAPVVATAADDQVAAIKRHLRGERTIQMWDAWVGEVRSQKRGRWSKPKTR